jgi:hypothetical protein
MSDENRRRKLRVVPLALALAMLSLVVVAGILPNTGVVSASSNCTYGTCPSSPSAKPFPFWEVATAVVVVILAALLALLLLRRRRRPPTDSPEAPAAAGAEAGATAETGGVEPTGGAEATHPEWSETQGPGEGDASSPDEGTPGSTG